MANRSVHPDKQLFQYLSGKLDEQTAPKIETHLSACPDCAALASVVRLLKSESAEPGSELSAEGLEASTAETGPHPDTGELASFFYGGASREPRPAVARHVASCASCAGEIALYAQAERLASDYEPARAAGAETPEAAREMIRDWEESHYAKPRDEAETLSREMLARLAHLVSERKDELLDAKRDLIENSSPDGVANAVPVLIIDRAGEFRGVEIFHREEGGAAGILKHAESSGRFDNKILHALLGFSDREPVVITEVIRRDAIELKTISRYDSDADRADYFIIED